MRFSNVSYPLYVTSKYFNQGSAQTQIQQGAVSGRPNNSTVVTKNFVSIRRLSTSSALADIDPSIAMGKHFRYH
jgi:hypothetical protein